MAYGKLRFLEWLFFIYFATHIPATLFINSQALLPLSIYPQSAIEAVDWYSLTYKDAMVRNGPAWYKSSILIELLIQLPFFFVASYAFYKGGQRWIRIPVIIYSSHVTTTVYYMLAEWYFGDFGQDREFPGPESISERSIVSMFYLPYFIIPLIMLIFMLVSKDFKPLPVSDGKSKYP
ncbi:Sigma intracellular receptor 2 [Holothuria leucospilota]|uniref:Sigma intracellular receptor 2 n=1 Tax=Holothuria leucospilota TaxID=206669 RepID=A0A9Q1CDB3_HOLLE|nr:Sigma intracellular receptor 2 [Holothuria leucospilota]